MTLALHWKILIGLVAGVAAGAVLNACWTANTWAAIGVHDAGAYLAGTPTDANAGAGLAAGAARFLVSLNGLAGSLFVRCLRFIAVPIVLFSLSAGVAGLGDIRKVGRIGVKSLAMFLGTTVLAVAIGIACAEAARPGHFVPNARRAELAAQRADEVAGHIGEAPGVSAWKTILELVPQNPFDSLARGDMLQIIVIAIALGAGLTAIRPERALPIIALCEAMTDVLTRIIALVIRAAPAAVFALIVPVVATTGPDVLRGLGAFVLSVVGALAVVLLIVYPILLGVLTPAGLVGPRRFFRAIAPAQLLAFSNSSSNATLPVTIDCVHRRLGVSEEITSFVCPLGASVSRNGTALYQAGAAVFVAQLYGVALSFGDLVALALTVTLVSLGAAGIPGAGIVLLVVVLQSVRLPTEGIAMLLGVDRLLDMCRTAVNVSGTALAAAVVGASEGRLAPGPAANAAP